MSEFVSSLWLLSSQGLSAKHQEKYNIIQSLAKNAEMPLGEHIDASFLPHHTKHEPFYPYHCRRGWAKGSSLSICFLISKYEPWKTMAIRLSPRRGRTPPTLYRLLSQGKLGNWKNKDKGFPPLRRPSQVGKTYKYENDWRCLQSNMQVGLPHFMKLL